MPILNRKPRPVDWNNAGHIDKLSRTKKKICLTTPKGGTTEGRLTGFTRTDHKSGMVRLELTTGTAHIGVRTDRDLLTVL